MAETYEKLVQLKQEGKSVGSTLYSEAKTPMTSNNGVRTMEQSRVKMQQNSMWI